MPDDLKLYRAKHLDLIQATPMTRDEFSTYAKIAMPVGVDPDEQGYLVNHNNFGLMRHRNHKGYISWLATDDFLSRYEDLPLCQNLSKSP